MIFIFGTSSKGVTERALLDTHCYACRRTTTWDLYRLTEWMSAFFLRVLPMNSEYYLLCRGCKDNLKLTKVEMKGIKSLGVITPKDSKDLHDHLVQRLEVHQLADKTETQREYLKAER